MTQGWYVVSHPGGMGADIPLRFHGVTAHPLPNYVPHRLPPIDLRAMQGVPYVTAPPVVPATPLGGMTTPNTATNNSGPDITQILAALQQQAQIQQLLNAMLHSIGGSY